MRHAAQAREGKSANELGEGSEIDLFEALRNAFEVRRIQRVPKGVNGADVIHGSCTTAACAQDHLRCQEPRCHSGTATAPSSRPTSWHRRPTAILSSNKFPKDKSQVHVQDGVIVANPARVLAIVEILRDQIVRMHELRISKEAREEKTVALYAFVTSDHFKQLVEQVEAQAVKMLDLDSKEQEAHTGASGTSAASSSAPCKSPQRSHLRDRRASSAPPARPEDAA
jgi:hypothetical protein